MKKVNKVITILLTIAMMCGLVACGSKIGEKHIYGKENGLELGTVEKEINPAEIFADLEMIPEFMYGIYLMDEDMEQYKDEIEYMAVDFDAGEKILTKIPYAIYIGPENVGYEFANVTDYNMAKLLYMSGNGSTTETVYAAYEVDNDKIKFTFVDYYEHKNKEKHLKYRMSDYSIEYDYKFNDSFSTITLSTGENNVNLSRSDYSENKGNDLLENISINNLLAKDSKKIDAIEEITINASNNSDYCLVKTSESDYDYLAIVEMNDQGLFTMTYEDKLHKLYTHQFAYIYCGSNGLILIDDKNIYFYTEKEKKYSDIKSDVVVEKIK